MQDNMQMCKYANFKTNRKFGKYVELDGLLIGKNGNRLPNFKFQISNHHE